jgi:putative endonuclease
MKIDKSYYVYIITNIANNVLYIGVTNNLPRRIYEHKNGLIKGFSKKYKTNKLVYYKTTNDINSAIAREKQLKNWHREWKINLVRSKNPGFAELFIS